MPDLVAHLPEWLAREAPEPQLFLNGISGLGGPFWVAHFESRFVGEGEPWQKAVALVESIAFLLQACADHMAPYVPPARRIRVSGGVSRIDGLCRRIASLTGLPVHRRDDPEASARGIAYLAAGRPEGWNSGAHEDVFPPQTDPALVARYRRWRALMAEATGV
jgi:glycerol kinase